MFPGFQGRGSRSPALPAPDLFQEVFQSRLSARLASRPPRGVGGKEGAVSGENLVRRNLQEGRQTIGAAREKTGWRAPEFLGSPREPIPSQTGKDSALAVKRSRVHLGSPSALKLPPVLKGLVEFMAGQPRQSLKVAPEQVLQVGSRLLEAGLSQEEVERLIFALGSPDLGLTAADLEGVWRRFLEGSSDTPSLKNLSASGATAVMSQDLLEVLQDSGYRHLWERLSVPQDLVSSLGLALARLGVVSPVLARLEGDSQGQGVPLSEVWEMLRTSFSGEYRPESPLKDQAAGEEVLNPGVSGEKQPVTSEELAAWRQILLRAGLPGDWVDRFLGEKPPATREELKIALLAMSPRETPPAALADPKPLYLPQNLRLRSLVWEGEHQGGRQLGGQAAGEGGAGGASAKGVPLAASLFSGPGDAAFPLSAYVTGNQSLPSEAAAGGPVAATPLWQLLSPEVRSAAWSQVQVGILSHLRSGETQVTLNLHPPELGQIQLTLRLVGQELAVTGVASRPEVAELVHQGHAQLLQTLAQQGFTLTQFEVLAKETPGLQMLAAGGHTRGKGTDTGDRPPTLARRRSGGVDRFV